MRRGREPPRSAVRPFVDPHETGDSPAYLAAAHALLHGSYSTPISASSYLMSLEWRSRSWLSSSASRCASTVFWSASFEITVE